MPKKLTSKKALELLKRAEEKTPTAGWIKHSKCVGNAAGIIAEKLGLDVDKAVALGYIHDIGKMVDNFRHHVMCGYNLLKDLGYDDEYCHICLTHSYLNNDVNCTGGGFPSENVFREEFIKKHQYTIYEKLITLCDLICVKKVGTLEQRLIDIIIRRGVHDNTVYHIKEAQKLKKEFDELLGYNVYDLFPEVKENL